jgi:hypothetical protein
LLQVWWSVSLMSGDLTLVPGDVGEQLFVQLMSGPTIQETSVVGVLLQFDQMGVDPVCAGDLHSLIHIHGEQRTEWV